MVEGKHLRVGAKSLGLPVWIDNHGIDLLHDPELNESLAFTGMEREPTVGTCAICGRPLTQDGQRRMPSLSR